MIQQFSEETYDKLLQVISQDVCDKAILEIFLKPPVHDPVQDLLQVSENKMSCEPTKEHVKEQELSQKPLQDPCQIHTEELHNEVLQDLCHVLSKFQQKMYH